MGTKRSQRSYDHRLVLLLQETSDPSIATRLGVPRSTVAGWLQRASRVVTAASADDEAPVLRRRVARLERRCRRLVAILHVVFALLRALKLDLSRLRVAAPDKARLLRAVERTRSVLGLRRVSALVAFYVAERNGGIPHSAFRGQTPDEVLFGKGDAVPDQLEAARAAARGARLAENRAKSCAVCT